MHTRTKWYCDICNNEFLTQNECQACENSHVKDEMSYRNKGIKIFFNLVPFYCDECGEEIMGVCEDCHERLDVQGTYNIEPVFDKMAAYPKQLKVKMFDNKDLLYNIDSTCL